MKVKSFYDRVFETTVLFMMKTTPKEIDAYLIRHGYAEGTSGYGETKGSVTFLDQTDSKGRITREYLLIVEDKKDFYCLLHETHHLATHIMHDRGIPIRQDNDEVAAYIQNYWFRTLWRFMNNIKVTERHI